LNSIASHNTFIICIHIQPDTFFPFRSADLMQLTITVEQRFYRTPDGRYWTDSLYPRSFWSRYLTVFDGVKILARAHEASFVAENWKRVDGDGVWFAAIPAYVGPWNFVHKVRRVRAAVARAIANDSAIMLRVPGLVSNLTCSAMRKGRPYGVEVGGDPYDVFSPSANSHPLRPFFRWWFSRALKVQCKRAACSLYVTEKVLQRRYEPTAQGVQEGFQQCREKLAVGISDVELPEAAFVADDDLLQRVSLPPNAGRYGRFRVAFVGSLEAEYKGLDVLIAALARCIEAGLDAELTIVGTGRQKPVLESLARRLGVLDRSTFQGWLPAGEPIRRHLDASDLLVLPSRVEGLPRALLEAMARGLACIGTRVGGVPELLPECAMVTPGNADGLTAKILELAANPSRRAQLGAQNLATARRFHEHVLQPKRIAFYQHLRDLTVAWQRDTTRARLAHAPFNHACTSQTGPSLEKDLR
jgi:glycosyltransferase involved in cell wall biosynthesis